MPNKRDRFTEAYYQYYPIVFNAVYVKVNDIDDTEDICQEVFIRFYNKIDEIENYKQWLYGTLKLVVFEYYRRKSSLDLNIDDVFNDVALTFVNGMRESRMLISETIDQIENQLDNEELVIFRMIAFYNYTYKETAKHTGMTLRKVEYRYSRIAAMIMDHLRKKGIKDLGELL